MKIIEKHSRMIEVKEGRKTIFNIKISKSGKNFHSFRRGLGIVSYCESLEECIDKTFSQMRILDEELKRRIIEL